MAALFQLIVATFCSFLVVSADPQAMIQFQQRYSGQQQLLNKGSIMDAIGPETQPWTSWLNALTSDDNGQSIIDFLTSQMCNNKTNKALNKNPLCWTYDYLITTLHLTPMCAWDIRFILNTTHNYINSMLKMKQCTLMNTPYNCDKLHADDVAYLNANGWILTYLDSFGKMPPGIGNGALRWDGSYKQCRNLNIPNNLVREVNNSFTHNLTREITSHNIMGKFCWGEKVLGSAGPVIPYSKFGYTCPGSQTLTNPWLLVALCMPDTCTDRDVTAILKNATGEAFCGAQCKENELDITDSPVAMSCLGFLCFLFVMMLIGTVLDYALKDLPSYQRIKNHKCLGIFMAFSMLSNGKKILDLQQREGQIHVLHGLRFFSITWVILGHTLLLYSTGNNLQYMVKTLFGGWFNLIVLNATVSVDTFFVLSGLLLAYLWLKEVEKSQGKKLKSVYFWFMYYFHRIVRLTPLLGLIIWVTVDFIRYFSNGPYWNQQIDPGCSKNWWATLLYINNVYEPNYICLNVTWYLSNDMQFYMAAPLLLLPFYFFPFVGACMAFMLILGSCGASGAITYLNGYGPSLLPSLDPDQAFKSISGSYNQDMYVPPWTRWSPFVVGLSLGWIMHRIRIKKISVRIPVPLNLLGWALAIIVNACILFGPYDFVRGAGTPVPVAALYAGLHRTLWSLGVCWVIFACHYGYGGPVNALLSWKVWQPFSRITYSVYLVHPLVMALMEGMQETSILWDNYLHFWSTSIAIVILSYLIALPLTCAIEMPIQGLESLFLRPSSRHETETSKSVGNGNKVKPEMNGMTNGTFVSPVSTNSAGYANGYTNWNGAVHEDEVRKNSVAL